MKRRSAAHGRRRAHGRARRRRPPDQTARRTSRRRARSSVTGRYAPTGEVLLETAAEGENGGAGPRPRPGDPLGLYGAHGRTVPKYREVEARPENHRFASYAAVLEEFP